jgi:hypothetical protein
MSAAVAAAMLFSGAALAAQDSPFPASPNETGLYTPDPYYAPGNASTVDRTAVTAKASPFPWSPNEAGPFDVEEVLGSGGASVADSAGQNHQHMHRRHASSGRMH